eukprot:TRINITY_DN5782_c0_g1_i1.p1 TRINITY_DN5782_c0_g1~~TRINITY_DN5782_c0_g1_i1.p1  ORF type:complete len:102 (-),score=28.94 TRINITY_DN5782_c0_g1_i1:2-307(-)
MKSKSTNPPKYLSLREVLKNMKPPLNNLLVSPESDIFNWTDAQSMALLMHKYDFRITSLPKELSLHRLFRRLKALERQRIQKRRKYRLRGRSSETAKAHRG